MWGITEQTQKIMKKNTAVKPHTKLGQLLVHPKDKMEQDKKMQRNIQNTMQIMQKKAYIGETGRTFNTRKKNTHLHRDVPHI